MADLSVASKATSVQGGLGIGPGALGDIARTKDTGGPSFRDTLARAAQTPVATPTVAAEAGAQTASLKFSAHAVDRMKSRGISFAPDMMKGIESAISKAAQKGAKDTLVLAGENALIVSVKNNTVVTVMDRAAMRDNVFTNIDSTVVV